MKPVYLQRTCWILHHKGEEKLDALEYMDKVATDTICNMLLKKMFWLNYASTKAGKDCGVNYF